MAAWLRETFRSLRTRSFPEARPTRRLSASRLRRALVPSGVMTVRKSILGTRRPARPGPSGGGVLFDRDHDAVRRPVVEVRQDPVPGVPGQRRRVQIIDVLVRIRIVTEKIARVGAPDRPHVEHDLPPDAAPDVPDLDGRNGVWDESPGAVRELELDRDRATLLQEDGRSVRLDRRQEARE